MSGLYVCTVRVPDPGARRGGGGVVRARRRVDDGPRDGGGGLWPGLVWKRAGGLAEGSAGAERCCWQRRALLEQERKFKLMEFFKNSSNL
jgi:hypothetical protein